MASDCLALSRQVSHGVAQGHGLAQHRGKRGTLYAHAQPEDEYRVEDGVGGYREQREVHSEPGIACGAYDAVEAKIQVRDDIAKEYDDHIAPGEGQGVLTGPEEIQDGVEEQQHEHREDDADDGIEREDVGEDLAGRAVILLAQQHGDECHGAHSHQRAQRCRKVHQRERHRQSGDGVRPHVLDVADVYAVDHVIQRSRSLGDDARDCVHLKKLAYPLCSQLGRSCT